MARHFAVAVFLVLSPSAIAAQRAAPVPFIGEPTVIALTNELSGAVAKRNLEFIARQHRMRASRQFRVAAEFIASELRRYGLDDVTINEIPADGKTMYGTQKARPAWDAESAELWELRSGVPAGRLASFEEQPLVLAQDSDSADVTADLVDVGAGTSERDYAGKDVRGKLVLISAQPGAAAPFAVDKFGAAGMLSYAQNQVTGWWKEDDNLIRWGHIDSFSPRRTFAFMLSLRQARALQDRLARGEQITLHATVRAARHPGVYSIVTAAIPGGDPTLRTQDIVFSCHLDHPRPGANDNASGCATILEVARTLSKLVREQEIARPARSIRFVWPMEIEGTLALLHYRPDLRARFRAAIHMDMVGGGPVTKAIFHVTRGPLSLPTFVNDVGQAFGAFVNAESDAFASGEGGKYPLVSPEGGKEPLLADLAEFSMGSDHQVYTDATFRIPTIYLNDWPDRYIHTNFDTPANIDPTKLQRAAFIGATSALYLANMRSADVPALWRTMKSAIVRRTATVLDRRSLLPPPDASALVRTHLATERAAFESIATFAAIPTDVRSDANLFFQRLEAILAPIDAPAPATGDAALVFQRDPAVSGPMSAFGYDYFEDRYKGAAPKLFAYQGLRGDGSEYAYEVLNLADGKRSARDIRDVVSAEYGPVPLEMVVEYLRALETAGVVRRPGAQHETHPAGHAHPGTTPTLGTIVFPNSGNSAAQQPFLRGIALLHSFEYEEAADAFREAQRADASFALAYWGEALSYSKVLWGLENLPASRAALSRLASTQAKRLAKARTARERSFGAAVEALYVDAALNQRVRAYADSMRRHALAARDDQEAAAFAAHALMLAGYRVPGAERDTLFREAIALAERVLAVNANHPGATHYLIHLYDSPGMAAQGLAFARAYDKIAPDAEHALHMPSHIYLQLGLWDDVVRSNERAWAASRASTPNAGQLDWHTFSWLQYAYLQQGRWKAARALIDTARTLLSSTKGSYADASVVIPRLEFQHASETRAWVTPLTRPSAAGTQPASDRERAFRQFASYWLAVDAAQRKDTALLSIAAPFLAIADSVRAGTVRSPVMAANALVVRALVADARGDRQAYLESLREAAELERTLNAFVGPPERVFALERLASELKDMGQAAEAIRMYEDVLRLCPNRSNALLGLVEAKVIAGDRVGATQALAKLRANWARADAEALMLAR